MMGMCTERGQKLGVFEYMARGSLRDLLDRGELSWAARMDVALGQLGVAGKRSGDGMGCVCGGSLLCQFWTERKGGKDAVWKGRAQTGSLSSVAFKLSLHPCKCTWFVDTCMWPYHSPLYHPSCTHASLGCACLMGQPVRWTCVHSVI